MPDLGAFQYLMDNLIDAGCMVADMAGERPLPWSEIAAFAKATGRINSAWESERLAAMSRAYIEGRRIGEEPTLEGNMPMRDYFRGED